MKRFERLRICERKKRNRTHVSWRRWLRRTFYLDPEGWLCAVAQCIIIHLTPLIVVVDTTVYFLFFFAGSEIRGCGRINDTLYTLLVHSFIAGSLGRSDGAARNTTNPNEIKKKVIRSSMIFLGSTRLDHIGALTSCDHITVFGENSLVGVSFHRMRIRCETARSQFTFQ